MIHTGYPRTKSPYSETPISANFPSTTQLKLQSSQHWLNIADDTGRAVFSSLKKARYCSQTYDVCRLVYIKPPANVTGFSRAFHNQLITALVKLGVSVSKTADAELVAEVDIQPILFSPNRPQYRYAGVPVELGPGVWALRDVASAAPLNAELTPPADSDLHWYRSEFAAGQTPQEEILVTVSIGDKKRYLSRSTNAYYIADADKRLYDQELCSLFKLCPAAADKGVPKAPSKSGIEITGDCPLQKPCQDEPPVSTPVTQQRKGKK